MSSPPQRDILSLTLRSRKALDHTKTLCTRADSLAKSSTELVLEVCAVDAKVRWVTEGITEQLKLVGSVAKSLVGQRGKLEHDAKAWDSLRQARISALDAILDDLGSQLVPPSFYETTSGSSLFGSQNSPKIEKEDTRGADLGFPNKGGVLNKNGREIHDERFKWKSLRYFVDERAVEEAVERMDEERSSLEDLLESTTHQTTSLTDQLSALQSSLPSPQNSVIPSLYEWLKRQEVELNRMAELLEDVTNHFGQMESALGDFEKGELSEEDMDVLEGDTEQLPSIIQETEDGLRQIEGISQNLRTAKESCEAQLTHLRAVLTNLESLEIEMGILVERHQAVELEAATIHNSLQSHLTALTELQDTYKNYRIAYGQLVQEMARRQQYRRTVEGIVRGMNEQLLAIREEEIAYREQFFNAQGANLPEDLCPFVDLLPTAYEVVSSGDEVAVDIDSQYVAEVRRYVAGGQDPRVSRA